MSFSGCDKKFVFCRVTLLYRVFKSRKKLSGELFYKVIIFMSLSCEIFYSFSFAAIYYKKEYPYMVLFSLFFCFFNAFIGTNERAIIKCTNGSCNC